MLVSPKEFGRKVFREPLQLFREWREEPILKKHDRKAFDCADPKMNDFLQRYARQSHESGAAKTFLAIDDANNKTIFGFYSLAPGALAYADAPEVVRRGLARHDVAGFRLVRIATDLRWQGQGLGGQLPLVMPLATFAADLKAAGHL